MAIRKVLATCLLLSTSVSIAYADDYYAGGSFLNVDYSEAGFEDDDEGDDGPADDAENAGRETAPAMCSQYL